MREITNPDVFQREMARLRRRGRTLGFVPTMGALHEGHISLMRASRRQNDVTTVSIFVNPTQFGPKEDFKKYPRPLASDKKLLKKAGVDFLFRPSAQAMYPGKDSTFVEPDPRLTAGLCGAFRPGHFRGVATVVAKLFHIALPHRAYFGAKDFQQAAVIQKMAEDLNFDLEVRVMPTVREKDGLAMSSRNRYLSAEDRKRALALSSALFEIRDAVRAGHRNLAAVKRSALAWLRRQVDSVDYLEIVDALNLQPLAKPGGKMAALGACRLGRTRLIDNVIITAPKKRF